MLDNLSGSSESEVVAKMQAARSEQHQTSAPLASTDEAGDDPQGGEESQADLFEGSDEEVLEESEPEEIGESDEAVETYRVKASGEELDVTLDQLIENFEKGHDYYKKTSKLADERKAFEAENAQKLAEVEAERQKLQATISSLSELVKTGEQSIDWDELRDTDPSEYLRQRELQDKREKALTQAISDQQQQIEQRRAELTKSESQKLLQVMGDAWKDPEVRDKDIESMYNYAFSLGFTQDDVSKILDHRFYRMAYHAAKYEEMQKVGDVVKKQIKAAPKTVKSKQPVKRANQDVAAAKKKLQTSGGRSTDDIVALMKAKRNR